MLGTQAGAPQSYPSPSAAMAAEILASSAVANAASIPPPQQQPFAMKPAGAAPPPQQPSLYMLQWHEHHASFFQLMEELCQSQTMTDVTIACGDVSLEAHSLILSASSPILRSILAKGGAGIPGRKQTLHFMDMSPSHMQLLLQYMYRGEVNVQQSQLGPLMQSAKILQIKGLCSSSADEKFTELSQQHHLFAAKGGSAINVPTVPTPSGGAGGHGMHFEEKKKRKSDWDDEEGGKAGSRRRKSSKKSSSMSPNVQSPTSTSVATAPAAAPMMATSQPSGIDTQMLVPKVEMADVRGEVGMVVDDESSKNHQDDDTLNGTSNTSMENWSETPNIKVKGHRIPVLPKALSQMKTTETRSYLSRLIWATNDWKRPQYGNPETKPIWWPNHLLNWSEMKKMGGKKSAGLTNVNYNEIQKNILHEGYKYFGFDPETLWMNVGHNQSTAAGPPTELTRTQEKLCHIMDSAAAKQEPGPSPGGSAQPRGGSGAGGGNPEAF